MTSGWQTKRLGEIAAIGAGNSAPQDERLFANGTVPFFRTSDAGRTRFGELSESEDYLTEQGARSLRRFPKGTILFPKSGASTFLNHRVMLGVEGCVSSHLATIVPDTAQVLPKFLLYFLSTVAAQDLVQDHAYPSLNLPLIASIEVPVPSLEGQLRIVARLDEAYTYLATATSNAQKNLHNAKTIFEGHLQSVFSQRGAGWVDRTLSSLCREITVGYVGPMAKEYKDTGVTFLRSQNIRPFHLELEGVLYISEEFDARIAKSRLRPGDVAVVRTGYPGTAAVIPESLPAANCADLVIVRPGPEVEPMFLAAFFNSTYGKQLVSGKLVGAAQKHFNVGAAKSTVLHVPPLREQRGIILKIEALALETQRLAGAYERKRAALVELRESLLHLSFGRHV